MRALILDLDNTLLDDRAATRQAWSEFYATHRGLLGGESDAAALARWQQLFTRYWLQFQRGEISFTEQRRQRVRGFLQRSLSDADADAAFEPYRAAYEASWVLVPGCREFLQLTKDIPKVIVTNGEREQQLLKIDKTGLRDHIVAAITPMDCGYWKPHHGIFIAALQRLNRSARHCLMIGDDLQRDIEPARELGMQAVQVETGSPQKSLLEALARWSGSS